MAKMFDSLNEGLIDFIQAQKIFFVGTAAKEGTINISPKGLDSLKILSPNKLIWLNLTGSGNETAAHLLKMNRMTIMFCSFDEKPLILRIYGKANTYHERDAEYAQFIHEFPELPGARQIYELQIERVQTSCGWAVPFMSFVEERQQLSNWAGKLSKTQMNDYRVQKNIKSIDDFETKLMG